MNNFRRIYPLSTFGLLTLHASFLMLLSNMTLAADSSISDVVPSAPKNCLEISQIEYVQPNGIPSDPKWQRYSDKLPIILPACIDANDINKLLSVATAQMLEDGWVTARFGVPSQDLNTGSLKLVLLVGALEEVTPPGKISIKRWRPGLAMNYGDPVNLRDIEQTVEQLNRLPSQRADIQVVSGTEPGMTKLALSMQEKGSLVRGSLAFDNYEPNRFTGTFGWDRPFGSTDQLNISVSHVTDKALDSYSINSDWSVGFGYNTVKVSMRDKRKHSTIFGAVETFTSDTESDGWQLDYTRRLYRNKDTLIDFIVTVARDTDASFIDGTEIDVQARDQGWGKIALRFSAASPRAHWVITGSEQQGTPNWWGDDDPDDLHANGPTHRYRIYRLDVSRTEKWQTDGASIVWNSAISRQHSHDILHGADMFSIGGRSSVRGFTSSLTSESGWHWRNQLSYIKSTDYVSETYLAYDIGEVYGRNTQFLPGTQLAGWAIGQKYTLGPLQLDFEIGYPNTVPIGLKELVSPTFHMAVKGTF